MVLGTKVFDNYVAKYGVDVTVSYNVAGTSADYKDVIMDKVSSENVEVALKARMSPISQSIVTLADFKHSTRLPVESVDYLAKFRIVDSEHIAKGNIVDTDIIPDEEYFQMLSPTTKDTHIEVVLKRRQY
jgi:hypothetical protein